MWQIKGQKGFVRGFTWIYWSLGVVCPTQDRQFKCGFLTLHSPRVLSCVPSPVAHTHTHICCVTVDCRDMGFFQAMHDSFITFCFTLSLTVSDVYALKQINIISQWNNKYSRYIPAVILLHALLNVLML